MRNCCRLPYWAIIFIQFRQKKPFLFVLLNVTIFSNKYSVSCHNKISDYIELSFAIPLYLKDHQVGEEHHWNQVVQGLKLAVPASGVASWTECLTTQIGDSMAWELWDASLGKFKM